MERLGESGNWQANLLVTGGVLLTVVVGLLLSQFDALQVRLSPTPLPLVAQSDETRQPATAVALTNTPLPAVILAEPSPTPSPAATPTFHSGQGTILCGAIPPGWSIYEVRAGDTLLSLSAFSGASATEISQVNCLQNGLLVTGMRIYLPVRRPTPVPCGPPWGWVQYRVAPGDTMFALALRHGTTLFAIMQANCLNNSALIAGRMLFLPPLRATVTPIRPLPTSTSFLTPTPTGTTTAVFTPSPTPSLTPTPGETPIIIATETPAATVSPTPLPTETATVEPSVSPTPSATPEPGLTPGATPTPPATPTSAPSPSPTATTAPPTATIAPPTATLAPPTATSPPPTPTPESGQDVGSSAGVALQNGR